MRIGIIGTGEPMIHAMVGIRKENTVVINETQTLTTPNNVHILTNNRIDMPFIDYEGRENRGKNKSKRRYPRPR